MHFDAFYVVERNEYSSSEKDNVKIEYIKWIMKYVTSKDLPLEQFIYVSDILPIKFLSATM